MRHSYNSPQLILSHATDEYISRGPDVAWYYMTYSICNNRGYDSIRTFNRHLTSSPQRRTMGYQLWVFCKWWPWYNGIALCMYHMPNASKYSIPDGKVHGAKMGPTWVLSAPDGPHVGPMNLAIRDVFSCSVYWKLYIYFTEPLKGDFASGNF